MKRQNQFVIYLKEAFGELKKVTWPSKNEVVQSTGIVIVFVIVVSLILGMFDITFKKLISYLFS